MSRELQRRLTDVLERGLGAELEREAPMPWLASPSSDICGRRWPVIQRIYAGLTDGLQLPAEALPARRHVDVLLQGAGGATVLEVDEIQHFNRFRATTLDSYPDDVEVAFPLALWHEKSVNKRKLEGGGFGRGRPLFRMEYGRHRERAFRDALTDLLPPEHGLKPTIRVASWELEPWIWSEDATSRLASLLTERTGDGWRVRRKMPSRQEHARRQSIRRTCKHVPAGGFRRRRSGLATSNGVRLGRWPDPPARTREGPVPRYESGRRHRPSRDLDRRSIRPTPRT